MAVLTDEILELREFFSKRRHILLGTLHGGVRNGDGQVSEEGPLGVIADELEGMLMDKIVRVALTIKHHLLVVVPKVLRIKGVRLPLAIVAVKLIPALIYRIAAGTGRAEAPFTKHPGLVAGFLQQLGDGDKIGGNRRLPFGLHLAIAAHKSVAGVHAVQQAAARRGAHGAASVVLGKLHAGSGHAIDVRGLEQFLPVTTQVAVAGVINHDENEVGLLFRLKR